MSNKKWTKGPWMSVTASQRHIHNEGDITHVSVYSEKTREQLRHEGFTHYKREHEDVANVQIYQQFIFDLSLDELNANANLIAAAPELYEALDKLSFLVECLGLDFHEQYEQAIAVLAKARGE